MVFSDNTHGFSIDNGFSQISRGFLLRNVMQCYAINYAMLCNLFSRSVLTKQFSYIKAKFFSITIFIFSVLENKVNGYLRKSISGLRNYFCIKK